MSASSHRIAATWPSYPGRTASNLLPHTLARLAERRDNETGKHIERVSLYCKLVAESLRDSKVYADEISDEFIEDIVYDATRSFVDIDTSPDMRVILETGHGRNDGEMVGAVVTGHAPQ